MAATVGCNSRLLYLFEYEFERYSQYWHIAPLIVENTSQWQSVFLNGFFFVHLFYVVKKRDSFWTALALLCLPLPAPVSAAALSRCRIRPTRARSSPRPSAWAPWSLGYCTAAGKSRQNTSLTRPVPLSSHKSFCHSQHCLWQAFGPNLISNSVKRTLAHVSCLNYQVVSYTITRQCFLFQSAGARPVILLISLGDSSSLPNAKCLVDINGWKCAPVFQCCSL